MLKDKLRFFICCMLLPMALFAIESKPQLILHFDINRTLIMVDPVGGKSTADCIMNTLADKYTDRWDERVLEPMCFSDYVRQYILPGSEALDPPLKKLRSQKIAQFLNFLIENNHPLTKQVKDEFDRVYATLESQSTMVLTSFYQLVDYLEENKYQYTIALRTFGSDLSEVMSDIEEHTRMGFFSVRGKFKEGRFFLAGVDDRSFDISEFYQLLKSHQNVAVQDDWPTWNRSGKMQAHGKLFPIDVEDESVVTLFFDDNVAIDPKGIESIVNPVNIKTNELLNVCDLIQNHRIFAVDTIAAIEDTGYYIRLVKKALEHDSSRKEVKLN